jgi:hypothetical protein
MDDAIAGSRPAAMQKGLGSPSARAKASSPSLPAQVAPEIAGQLWRIMRRGEKEETVEKLTVHGRHLKVLSLQCVSLL